MIFHVQDEDRAIAAACKESLKNVSQLYKEVEASQGALSLDSRKHSKATTSLEAFLVMHILQLTGFFLFRADCKLTSALFRITGSFEFEAQRECAKG